MFWAVTVTLILAGLSYGAQGIMGLAEVTNLFMRGVGGMMPIMILLMLAFVMDDTCRALGTGPFVAAAAEAGVTPGVIPAALFLVGAVTSFSTGTSWGTWAIMFPVAMPMVEILGLDQSLVIGAVLWAASLATIARRSPTARSFRRWRLARITSITCEPSSRMRSRRLV